jgi:hypothetical protein
MLGLATIAAIVPAMAQTQPAQPESAPAQPAPPQPAQPDTSPLVTLTSPLDFQVFQRQARCKGSIQIRGIARAHADRAEARVTGNSPCGTLSGKWKRLSLNAASGEFQGDLAAIPGGFYQVEIRLAASRKTTADVVVPHVGVGEVFVISGQSNATNYGEVPQKVQTGMVTSFSGTSWRIADDPQPGVQDNSSKGSFIPPFGDALFRKYGVPIGIASVGHGSTSVRQWLPQGERMQQIPTMTKYVITEPDGTLESDGTLFNGMMARIQQLGVHGFRALLWHQGESDANQKPGHQISPQEYEKMMELIIQESRKKAGWDFPWIVAEASYHTPDDPSSEPIRSAQRDLWSKGIALEGPDTDTLGPSYRQNGGTGVHFSDAGLKAHGLLWATKVEAYLDQVLR